MRDHRSVREVRHAVNNRLGVNDHIDLIGWDIEQISRLDQLQSLLGAESLVWVGATWEEDAWRWPSGAFVDPVLWAEGEPRDGFCAALSLQSGALESRDCDDALSLLCLEGNSE